MVFQLGCPQTHVHYPLKLLGGMKRFLTQGAPSPVFASIDVKICQEFHSLLVKVHSGAWAPLPESTAGLCDLTVGSCPSPLLLGAP